MIGKIVVIIGQTASGKTTLTSQLSQNGFQRIISYTTRPIRENEVDGKSYHFLTEDKFYKLKDKGFFAETTEYNAAFGHCLYGTSRESLEISSGSNKVLALNPRGARELKTNGYDIFLVWLDIDQEILMKRALVRGDSPIEVSRRMLKDTKLFQQIHQDKLADLHITDANLSPSQILSLIQDAIT